MPGVGFVKLVRCPTVYAKKLTISKFDSVFVNSSLMYKKRLAKQLVQQPMNKKRERLGRT